MKKANIGLALLLALVTLAGCDQQGVTSAGSSSESSTGTSSSAGDSGSSSTPVVETHSILIGETGGAIVTPSKETAASGERITLTIDCPEGKEVDTVSLSVVEVEVTANPDGTYSFLMPAGDVTVTVTLKDEVLSSYVLTIDNKAGVEIVDLMDKGWNTIPANADGTYDLKPNETYTLLIKPGSGTGAYRVRIGDTVIQANEGSYSFTMPASDATITIETIPSYKVTLDYDADAISEVYLMDSDAMTELNAGSIIEGTNVYVSPSANPGYAVTGILLDGEALELEGTSAFFTMPAKDVTITIETEGQAPAGHAIDIQEPDGISISIGSEIVENETYFGTQRELVPYPFDQTTWEAGETIYVQAKVMGSYTKILTLEKVTWNGNEIALDEDGFGSFVMPEEGVVLTAETEWIYYNLSFDGGDTGITATFANEEGTTAVAHQGETITVTLDVPEGVTVDQVLVNGTPAEDKYIGWTESEEEPYVYTFTMPYQDIAISVEASVPTTGHALSYKIEGTTDPTLSATFYNESQEEITTAKAGETVYIMVSNAPLNHKLVGVYLGDTALGTTLVDGWTRYVIEEMPDEDVEIRIVYAEGHSISVDTAGNPAGTNVELGLIDSITGAPAVVHNPNQTYYAGDTVYVKVTAGENVVSKVLANETEIQKDATYSDWYSFEMPGEDIVIKVQWASQEEKHAITWAEIPDDIDYDLMNKVIQVGGINVNSAAAGAEVTVYLQWWERHDVVLSMNGTPLPIDHTAGNIDYYVFEMPDEDAVLTVAPAEAEPAETYELSYNTSIAELNDTIYVDFYTDPNSYEPVFEAEAGTKIYAWIRNFDGYEIESVTLNGVALETETVGYLQNTYYVFTMPEAAAQIEINLKALESAGHAITYEFVNGDGREYVAFYYDNGSGNRGSQIPLAALNNIEAGERIYIDVTNGSWDVPSKVTMNDEEVTEMDSTGLYFAFTMPDEDAHLVFTWEDSDASTYALTYDFVGTEDGSASFYTQNPGGWMDQLPLTGLGTIAAGEKIYIDVYENGTWAAPTSVTLNGNAVTETYFDGSITYYVIEMPEQDSHLVFTWEGGEEEPPVTTTQNLIYEPAESDNGAEVMFFPGTGPDAGSITTAKAGDTVLVYVWCETATPSQVLVNGEPATPSGDYDSTWEFVMPDEGDAKITLVWEEAEEPVQSNLVWVPEEDAPEGAEVKFYDADDTSTEITYSNPGEIVCIEITGGLPSGGASGVKVNGEAVYVFEMAGYYAFEMPEGTATVTIDWFNY